MSPAIRLVSLFFFALASTAAAEQASLVGAWRYVGEVDTRADGSPGPPEALSDAEGLLLYTANGFMSATILPKGRRWSGETATLPELRETVGNGTAYAGRYEVDAANHTVTHITSVSLDPAFQGRRLVRTYSLHGDVLELSGTFPYQGETIHFTVTWARLAPDRMTTRGGQGSSLAN